MKIFGIGFHKTGTTTLEVALDKLGYSVADVLEGMQLLEDIKKNKWERVYDFVDQHDAFQDNPWPLLYKHLDEQYPGSKFILTKRDEEKWLKSLIDHCDDEYTAMREWIYGYGNPKGHEDIYLDIYRKFNKEVINYFKNRENDLLIVDWEKGDGWDELCPFLGDPIPNTEFPHAHKKKNSFEKRMQKLKHFLKNKFVLF